MAEAIVHGRAKLEPPEKDNKRNVTAPQIWLTSGDHQVTISPFWEQAGLPTEHVHSWIVTGYEMDSPRREAEASAEDVPIERIYPQAK
jgi:hypothetical protein